MVQRSYHSFPVTNKSAIKSQMLSWCNRFNICCFLDNNLYPTTHHSVECIAGIGALQIFTPHTQSFFDSLSSFVQHSNDYIFGHFNYEIKDRIEKKLISSHIDYTHFPEYFLFIPEVVLILDTDTLHIGVIRQDAGIIFQDIIGMPQCVGELSSVNIYPRLTKAEYIDAVQHLISHIRQGDCYVINYCHEFFANAKINPLLVFHQLNRLSPNPFAAFYKLQEKYLLCASPERFIKKEGNKLISQPIKGTSPRNHTDIEKDNENRQWLYSSKKERSENVMVVDLVRNDLGKICKAGTVEVEELFGLYSFPSVHQMISTVHGELNDNIGFGDIIKAMFPMGSMTGAPKHKVMQLVEMYEKSMRGVYSGTVGYITPTKDFDFNVVIRSIVYNADDNYLSYHTGSAITAYCNPEEEYNECLLKGSAIAKVLGGKIES